MENNIHIIPAKIDEKPLKVLGILSLVGAVLKAAYLVVGEFYSYIHPDIVDIILEAISNILGVTPFILFGIYAIFLGKEKINHSLLSASYITLAVSCIYSVVYTVILNRKKFAYAIETGDVEEIIFELIATLFTLIPIVLVSIFCFIVAKDVKKMFTKAKAFRVIAIIFIVLEILSVLSTLLNYVTNGIIDGYFNETAFFNSVFFYISTLLHAVPFYLFWCVIVKPAKKLKPVMPVYDIPAHAQPAYNTPPVNRVYAPVQPVAQPMYQPPVQPVAQPMYQPPVQPVAQPMYQPPVQPVAQPMYQTPVQPVAQPMYQPPVQPVAQPMYQPPVQPVRPAVQDDVPTVMLREDKPEEKLANLKNLLDKGLISQEDFDKKKAEILEKM